MASKLKESPRIRGKRLGFKLNETYEIGSGLVGSEMCIRDRTGTVERHIGTASVPEEVKDQAILQVAGNLWARRAQSAQPGLGEGIESAPAYYRPALDPLTPARPILAPWLKGAGLA
ncbi:hypothetical protein ACX3T8_13055, partial [Corynebacterium pyruviciproducens]